jgi:hypothetical protein
MECPHKDLLQKIPKFERDFVEIEMKSLYYWTCGKQEYLR